MASRTSPALLVALAPLALLAIGCGNIDQQLAEASVTSALTTSKGTQMTRMVYESTETRDDGCLDPVAAAEEAAARPAVGLYPSSCVTKTADGASLHSELDDCTGPFGKLHLDGGVDATLTAPACDVVHAEIVDSGDLTGNGSPIEYSASADIRVEGALRAIDFAGHSSGTTARGDDWEATSDLDVVLDSQSGCVEVGGSAHGSVKDWEVDMDISGLALCPDACPSAGTVDVFVDGPRRDRSLVIRFDGSSTAKVVGTNGDELTVEMVCDE